MIQTLISRFSEFPRAVRWSVLFALFCGGYFVVVEPVMDRTRQVSERADRLEAALARLAELESADSGSGRDIATALVNFGAPLMPSDPEARADSVYSAVNEILDRHSIDDRSITERLSAMRDEDARVIGGGAAPGTSGSAVTRLILDIAFEATPETVAAVLADLERSRHITAVARMKLDKPGTSAGTSRSGGRPPTSARALRANIVAEAWVSSAVRPRQSPPTAVAAPSPELSAPTVPPEADPAP